MRSFLSTIFFAGKSTVPEPVAPPDPPKIRITASTPTKQELQDEEPSPVDVKAVRKPLIEPRRKQKEVKKREDGEAVEEPVTPRRSAIKRKHADDETGVSDDVGQRSTRRANTRNVDTAEANETTGPWPKKRARQRKPGASKSPHKPKTTDSKATKTTKQEARDDADGEVTKEEFSFLALRDYRWVDDKIEIKVEWASGPSTWEPEDDLQRDAGNAVLDYWRQRGGRPPHPKDPDLFTIFAVVGHSGDRKRIKVQWAGFGPQEDSWVSRATVEDAAPEMLEAYFEKLGQGKRGSARERTAASASGVKTPRAKTPRAKTPRRDTRARTPRAQTPTPAATTPRAQTRAKTPRTTQARARAVTPARSTRASETPMATRTRAQTSPRKTTRSSRR